MQFEFGFECLAVKNESQQPKLEVEVNKPPPDTEVTVSVTDAHAEDTENAKIRVGDIVVYTYLTGRPCPQLGYVCERKEAKVTEPTLGYTSPKNKAAKIKIVPLTRLASGRWVKSSNRRKIITRVEYECFQIPEHLADLNIK